MKTILHKTSTIAAVSTVWMSEHVFIVAQVPHAMFYSNSHTLISLIWFNSICWLWFGSSLCHWTLLHKRHLINIDNGTRSILWWKTKCRQYLPLRNIAEQECRRLEPIRNQPVLVRHFRLSVSFEVSNHDEEHYDCDNIAVHAIIDT